MLKLIFYYILHTGIVNIGEGLASRVESGQLRWNLIQ